MAPGSQEETSGTSCLPAEWLAGLCLRVGLRVGHGHRRGDRLTVSWPDAVRLSRSDISQPQTRSLGLLCRTCYKIFAVISARYRRGKRYDSIRARGYTRRCRPLSSARSVPARLLEEQLDEACSALGSIRVGRRRTPLLFSSCRQGVARRRPPRHHHTSGELQDMRQVAWVTRTCGWHDLCNTTDEPPSQHSTRIHDRHTCKRVAFACFPAQRLRQKTRADRAYQPAPAP